MVTSEQKNDKYLAQQFEKRILQRRGFGLGTVFVGTNNSNQLDSSVSIVPLKPKDEWQKGNAMLLPRLCEYGLNSYQQSIVQSHKLYETLLAAEYDCDELLACSPYASRLEPMFESLGSSVNEGDDQEIETVLFDALDKDGEVVAEDLWMKASWLSFHDEDASLRFRFSFGVDLHEDVAADENRQYYASLLTDAVFPESRLISKNDDLNEKLCDILGSENIHFVERIIYFNSPNGGAYLHHDRERGHAGVVFAQITGETFWLALPKKQLIQELIEFVQFCHSTQSWPDSLDELAKQELLKLSSSPQTLSDELESFANTVLIHTMNETQEFVQHLIEQGHGKHLVPGDVLLLPQETDMECCWHSVFCLTEEPGQALSFAIRTGV